MESTSESSQPEKPSARGPLHEERSLSVDSATVDNDASINAFDVLCGRGKTSFNHGKRSRHPREKALFNDEPSNLVFSHVSDGPIVTNQLETNASGK